MFDWIVLRKLIAGLLLPPSGPLLCAAAGLLLIRRRPRAGYALAWLGIASIFAFSLPIVSGYLIQEAGVEPALDLSRPVNAQAIVILGGGVRRNAPDYARDTLGILSLERVRYGAFIARKTGLPILVTGGVVWEGEAEAKLMRDTLQEEFKQPVRWVEDLSRNTYQNAIGSAAILKADGVSRVVLVSHAFDAKRARLEFEAAGLAVVSAPTGAGLAVEDSMRLTDFLPNPQALLSSYYATYELLAMLTRGFTSH